VTYIGVGKVEPPKGSQPLYAVERKNFWGLGKRSKKEKKRKLEAVAPKITFLVQTGLREGVSGGRRTAEKMKGFGSAPDDSWGKVQDWRGETVRETLLAKKRCPTKKNFEERKCPAQRSVRTNVKGLRIRDAQKRTA